MPIVVWMWWRNSSSAARIRRWRGEWRSGLHRFRVVCGVVAVGAALVSAASAPAHAASPAPKTSPAVAKNLLAGNNAVFSTGIGTWTNFSNATLQWAPTSGEGGSGALAVTANGPNMAVASGSFGAGGLTFASAGQIYSGSIAAESPGGPQSMQPVLSFYTAAGSVISAVFGPDTTVGASQWAPLSPALAIAPQNTAYVQLGVVVYAGAGSTAVFDDAWVEQAGMATTPAVVGPLATLGNQIVQSNGKPLTLRGVVLNGLEDDPSSPAVTQRAVLQAKTWGASIVRLPLGEQFWLPSNCDYAPGYAATVSQVVNWITSLGMVALLDLHYNTVNGCETGTPHNMADEAQAPTFWSQVAAQFASNPLVAFDLYNEPHDISDAVWLNGGPTTDSYPPSETYLAAGMQQLYNTVRATGANNLVFISGNNWANTVPSQLVQGQNIVYAAHVYDCLTVTACQANLPADYDPSPILSHWVTLSSSIPVMVTEFGWPSEDSGTFDANVISYAASRGWGWIAFAWEDTQYPSGWDVNAGFPSSGPVEPAPLGIPVLCAFVAASSGVSPCTAPSFSTSSASTTQNSPSKTTSALIPSDGSNLTGTGLRSTTVGVLGPGLAGGSSGSCKSSCGSGGGSGSGPRLERAGTGRPLNGTAASPSGLSVTCILAGLVAVLAVTSRRGRRLARSTVVPLWVRVRTASRWLTGGGQGATGLGDVGALPG